jgi:hypothetical protein
LKLPPTLKDADMKTHSNPRDEQVAHTGKVVNDHNKVGDQPSTQINQSKRTPESRSDRESHIGSDNQSRERRGKMGH